MMGRHLEQCLIDSKEPFVLFTNEKWSGQSKKPLLLITYSPQLFLWLSMHHASFQ
jgi:hypothetical protein